MIDAELQEDGSILRLWLAAPKANVLDAKMIDGLAAALDAHVGPRVKAIVFEGRGPHFSFGASVAEHTRAEAPAMLHRFHALFRQLGRLAIPTVALVRGQCLGGGLELASWCTWLAATPDARLGQPEIRLGVFPPMASLLLPWRLGGNGALDLCVSGRTVSGVDAHRLGLVTAVADDVDAWWNGFHRENLANASASSLRFAERAVRAGLLELLETRLPVLERLYLDELMATHDANEGIEAFLAKRTAGFRHQ